MIPPLRFYKTIQSAVAASAACVVALAGCSGSVPGTPPAAASSVVKSVLMQFGTPAQRQALGLESAFLPAKPVHNVRHSWMAREAGSSSLLYVSAEAANEVYVYSYPNGKQVGMLTGFNTPSGMCTDRAGDVYILDGGGFSVEVYAHGGTSPIRTLSLPGYPEFTCSVNPRNGDLAVSTTDGSCAECAGYIAIFTGGQGIPTTYQPTGQIGLPGCGYDTHGNLFCDAYSSRGRTFVLYELPNRSKTVETITMSGTLPKAGPVQWDGQDLAVGSGASGTIDRIAISGTSGSVAGSTDLGGGTGWVWQFWITKGGTRLIAPTYAGTAPAEVGYWSYPAGGDPTKTIVTSFTQPDGATVSR